MKRILIVSPHFAPAAAPDGQRARMMLPYLRELGWEPTVLAVSPRYVDCPVDNLLCETFPQDLEMFFTEAMPSKLTRLLGFSTLGWRSWPFMKQVGNTLLRKKKFDLVYFSTTQFLLLNLANYWKKKFAVPYVVDIQDPWLKEEWCNEKERELPGGSLKFGIAQLFASRNEPRVLSESGGITVVSPYYKEMLLERYPSYRKDRIALIPFGSLPTDWSVLEKFHVRHSVFSPQDGKIHIVYMGRGGQDLLPAARVLFDALSHGRESNPELYSKLKLHFVGTSYAPKGRERKTFSKLLKDYHLESCVFESAQRLPYFQALSCMNDATVLVVLGSDDKAYSPSKLYPYMMTGKPLIVFAHKDSVLEEFADKFGVANLFRFSADSSPSPESVFSALERVIKEGRSEIPPSVLESVSARAMSVQLVQLFDQVLERTNEQ